MKTIAGLLALLLLIAVGCDPVRRIDMKNETGDTVKFIWKLREDSLLFNPFLLSNSKDLVFVLTPSKSRAINLSFGEGSWTPSEVKKLTGHLESLEIVSAAQRIKIDSLPLLKDFLLARRRGIGGARIEIAIRE